VVHFLCRSELVAGLKCLLGGDGGKRLEELLLEDEFNHVFGFDLIPELSKKVIEFLIAFVNLPETVPKIANHSKITKKHTSKDPYFFLLPEWTHQSPTHTTSPSKVLRHRSSRSHWYRTYKDTSWFRVLKVLSFLKVAWKLCQVPGLACFSVFFYSSCCSKDWLTFPVAMKSFDCRLWESTSGVEFSWVADSKVCSSGSYVHVVEEWRPHFPLWTFSSRIPSSWPHLKEH